jgi:hypothetical protein
MAQGMKDETMMRGPAGIALAFLLASMATACKGVEMKPFYPESVVQPIVVEQRSDAEIAVRYRVYPESNHYSGGVDYEQAGDALRIVIARCAIGEQCEPMARSAIPLDDAWEAEVHLPYRGGQVIVVHSDGEQQVYP